jgi:hypothetical protein
MLSSRVNTEYSIHRVQHTPSTACTEYNIHRVQHTPCTAYTEYSIHRVQHTPSTAYTEYSIHRVQHTEDRIHCVLHHTKMDCLPFTASLSALSGPCCTQFSTFPQLRHQQNVNQSGSHRQTSQTLRQTSLVLQSNSRLYQAPLELSKVLSDSARAISGAFESTCSYEGAFRMLQDLTCRIVKFWSCRDLCTGLRET